MKFIFQGSQILYVRVPISYDYLEIQFPNYHRMID